MDSFAPIRNAKSAQESAKSLNEAVKGQKLRISAIGSGDPDLDAKLREIGFSEGDEVELLTRGPFTGQRLAVRLNRTIIALRAAEARAVAVETL